MDSREILSSVKMLNTEIVPKGESNANGECISSRSVLQQAIAEIAKGRGVTHMNEQCLETLTEMMQSLIKEIAKSTHDYAEHNNRILPCMSDVQMALITMGLPVGWLEEFSCHKLETKSSPDKKAKLAATSLVDGKQMRNANNQNMWSKYYPAYPQPHTYMRTPVFGNHLIEYEAIRQRKAEHKREMQIAANRFLCKVYGAKSYFSDTDPNLYPLVPANVGSGPAYLRALNPNDQVFDYDDLEYHYMRQNHNENALTPSDNNNAVKPDSKTNNTTSNNSKINNPYLLAPKLAKRSNSWLIQTLTKY